METRGSNALQPSKSEYYTVAQWRTWGDESRWELIEGQAWDMSPAPTRRHQWIVIKLASSLDTQLATKPCQPYVSPIDVYLPQDDQAGDQTDTVVQPDLLVVCDPGKLVDEGIRGAPDFIIEILSPSTAWKDQTAKRRIYEQHGVREYWILNPESLDLLIYRHDGQGFGPAQAANLLQAVPVGVLPGLVLQLPRG